MKKKAATSWTIEEAQRTAGEIAKKFGLFQCDRCATDIARLLGKSTLASFERLRTADQSDVIGLQREGIQISTNGTHVGVRLGDRIIDNLHPEGVPADDWIERFITATDAPLVQQSRPVSEFFGKGFLAKRFQQWLLGT